MPTQSGRVETARLEAAISLVEGYQQRIVQGHLFSLDSIYPLTRAEYRQELVTPFKGERTEVLIFIANINTAFDVIDPRNATTWCKFVLTRISGEEITVIARRYLEN